MGILEWLGKNAFDFILALVWSLRSPRLQFAPLQYITTSPEPGYPEGARVTKLHPALIPYTITCIVVGLTIATLQLGQWAGAKEYIVIVVLYLLGWTFCAMFLHGGLKLLGAARADFLYTLSLVLQVFASIFLVRGLVSVLIGIGFQFFGMTVLAFYFLELTAVFYLVPGVRHLHGCPLKITIPVALATTVVATLLSVIYFLKAMGVTIQSVPYR